MSVEAENLNIASEQSDTAENNEMDNRITPEVVEEKSKPILISPTYSTN